MIHLDGHVTGAVESVETSFTTVSFHTQYLENKLRISQFKHWSTNSKQ